MIDTKTFERLGLVATGGLALSWCVASLWFPLGWDQGIMASVGDTILRGGMPYRDAWDMKGPFSFYIFALAQWIFGRTMWGIRVFDVVLLLAACVALSRIVARFTTPRIGLWAGIAFLLWYASLTWFFVSQPDGWVALLTLLAFAPLLSGSEQPGPGAYIGCGVAIGFCVLIKPFYAALGVVPVVHIMLSGGGFSLSRRIVTIVFTGFSAIVPIGLMVGWFAHRGALDSLLEVHVQYASAYAGDFGIYSILRRIYNYFWSTGMPTPAGAVAVVLPAITLAALLLWRENRQAAATLVAWLLIALASVTIQGKFWVYHWIPTYPPFVILAAVGLSRLVGATDKQPTVPVFVLMAAAFFIGQIGVTPTVDVVRWLALMTGFSTHEQYYERYFRRFYVAADDMEAARYIQEHTSSSDAVAVWGNDATVNFLSGRPNPTRFVFSMPLTRDVDDLMRKAYRREYIGGLLARPPVYIVIGQPHDGSPDKFAKMRTFPELSDFFQSRYRPERQFGFLELYRLVE